MGKANSVKMTEVQKALEVLHKIGEDKEGNIDVKDLCSKSKPNLSFKKHLL